ncbi:MAG: outer membrane protein transport protein [Ghiorsea sp.]|nr:outer membrane protein transport protein [Ghiorsea sp.]
MFLLPNVSMKKMSFFAFLSVCFLGSTVHAATFVNSDITPTAAGSANAVVTGSGHLTDAFYNPSGLAWQEGVQAMFVNQTRYRNSRVDVAGVGYDGLTKPRTADAFAISWLPRGGNLGISGSISKPYASRSDWSASYANLGFTDLEIQRYALDGFWRVNNTLGVSAGFDMYDTSLRMDTNNTSFSGSDWSDVGGHAGLRWEPIPFWTLGVHYRQGVNVQASNNVNDIARIQLPDELIFGLSHTLWNDEMLLALDIKRSNWSTLKSINVSNSGVNLQTNIANLRDTTDVMLGATWFWRHNTQFRFGYAYEQGANQADGFQPLLADLTGHKITLGFGGMMSSMHLDMTWTGALYNKMNATGAYAGTYSDNRYSFMFSLSKKF